jgi:cell division transport system permease protein
MGMGADYNAAPMALFRALAYFLEEALQSLWRSRLMNALSVGTIGISLFVLGAFMIVAGGLAAVVDRWADKVQVTFYLEDGLEDHIRKSLETQLREHAAVEAVEVVTRAQALDRFRRLFRDLATLPDDLGQNPFPASLEVTLRAGHHTREQVRGLADAFSAAPGVQEVHYDLLWIDRLGTALRLVRGMAALLGGVLVSAAVFTISNVIRLTVYARQDEIDIMRLVGATPAYIKGPFVAEGMIQGGLGGLLASGLLAVALRMLASDTTAASELLGRVSIEISTPLVLTLVAGGMAVGVAGSLVSLGRNRI